MRQEPIFALFWDVFSLTDGGFQMKIIGLCGGSGSGKGTVASLFAERGVLHIDTDRVYHRLTSGKSPCLDELCGLFGEGILSADGALDRRALSEIVFSERGSEARAMLNSISHRHVLAEVRRIIKDAEGKYPAVIVDAPLLFESGFDEECDLVVAVTAKREHRIQRIISRDNITLEAAERRIEAQIGDSELILRADFVITNDTDVESLKGAVDEILTKINA